MKAHIRAYAIALAAFALGDFVWVGIVAQEYYVTSLSHILANQFFLAPLPLFYVLHTAGLYFFVIMRVQNVQRLSVFLTGAFFGLCTYGTYDLTNQITLRDWPLHVTLVDMLWGAFLSGTASIIATISRHPSVQT